LGIDDASAADILYHTFVVNRDQERTTCVGARMARVLLNKFLYPELHKCVRITLEARHDCTFGVVSFSNRLWSGHNVLYVHMFCGVVSLR
jgi:hypothetical protein